MRLTLQAEGPALAAPTSPLKSRRAAPCCSWSQPATPWSLVTTRKEETRSQS